MVGVARGRRTVAGNAVNDPATAGIVVWWDDPADGPTNMAADERLAVEADRRGTMLVRIYGWTTTTVSLGAFQRFGDAHAVPEIAGVPLVRRPSGGGAIVHGSDLTYAAAVPRSHPWGASAQSLYDALHGAMADELASLGVGARAFRQIDEPRVDRGNEQEFFCFDRRSSGDLVVDHGAASAAADSKIMGSAQRRLVGVVLQHGSLLLRGNPGVRGAARHPGIAETTPRVSLPESRDLARAWMGRVAALLGASIDEQTTSWVRDDADAIAAVAVRFRDTRWTCRR